MTWLLATLLLLMAAPFVLWPLIRHLEPQKEADGEEDSADLRRRRLEEIELDLESGRLDPEGADLLRRELAP